MLYSKVSIYGAIFFVLTLILLSLLFVFNGHAYDILTSEDSLFESSAAFLFPDRPVVAACCVAFSVSLVSIVVATLNDDAPTVVTVVCPSLPGECGRPRGPGSRPLCDLPGDEVDVHDVTRFDAGNRVAQAFGVSR